MAVSAELLERIKASEGCIRHPYRDPLGFLTIGYGHNLDAKDISQRAADVILEDDLADAELILRVRFPWAAALDTVRRESLLELIFNMGSGTLTTKNPKMLAAFKAGDYVRAAAELLDGPYKDEVGDRAQRIAQQIRTGTWG